MSNGFVKIDFVVFWGGGGQKIFLSTTKKVFARRNKKFSVHGGCKTCRSLMQILGAKKQEHAGALNFLTGKLGKAIYGGQQSDDGLKFTELKEGKIEKKKNCYTRNGK